MMRRKPYFIIVLRERVDKWLVGQGREPSGLSLTRE